MKRKSEGSERWIKYYSSAHNILLVGEGDFSFSVCLGKAFASATNIIATTLDSYGISFSLSLFLLFFFFFLIAISSAYLYFSYDFEENF